MIKYQPKSKEQKVRRKENRKAGLCSCGRERWKPYRCCKACVLRTREASKRRLERLRPALRALGICIRCTIRRAVPGAAYCGSCQEYSNSYKTEKRAGRIKDQPRRKECS